MDDPALTIGELADAVGLNTSAIRYYERVGVLPPATRVGGRRRYAPDAVRRLRLLEVVKGAGFSLGEARVLLAADDGAGSPSAALRDLAERRLADVEALIARATAVRDWLRTASACSCETLDVCALFEPPAGEAPRAALRATPVRPAAGMRA